jgi:dethiobiotin synthetase
MEPEIEFMADGPEEFDEPTAESRHLPDGTTAYPDDRNTSPTGTAGSPDEPINTLDEPSVRPDRPATRPVEPVPSAMSPGTVEEQSRADVLPSDEALGAESSAESSVQATPSAQAAPSAQATPSTPAAASAQGAPRRAEGGEWRGIVLVTGTDTDVGKTIVTAAVAAAAQAAGLRVAVIKPGQTGTITGAPTDIDVISRLAGPDTVRTLAEYPEPMAPLAAATVAELPPLELYEVVDAIRAEAEKHDLVLVEGAGGLLVPMGVRPSGESWTVADLATTLGVSTLVVARAGLGTLNHTALTLEALDRRGVPAGVIIGAWPSAPELVHWANLSELVPHLVGALPEGAGRMDPGVFQRSAPGWLTPALYGVLDNWRVWADEVS